MRSSRGDSTGDASASRDEAMARLTEELKEASSTGRTLSFAALAEKHGVSEVDVRRCMEALEVLQDALGETIQLEDEPREGPPLPTLPDDYEILGEIGRGGMGIVYRARQKSLDREVAVKVLRPGDVFFGTTLQRFQKEAKSLGRLQHPNIVAIHEVGEVGAHVFYSMDLIQGDPLDDLIRRGEMTAARAVKLLRQVASAIAYTHSHGLIHRDLKPANILVDGEGKVFVVDFGLARELEVSGGEAARITGSGHVVGTPAYMSPEQARGEANKAGEATDVYALGAVLYECLTGRAPFDGTSLGEVVYDVIHKEPPAPRKITPRVPVDLEIICQKAMSKEPHRRYATAQAFQEDLERFEKGRPIGARRPSAIYRALRFGRRNRVPVVTALAVAGFLFVIFWTAIRPSIGRTPALLLDFADEHHAAGRHETAADGYESILGRTIDDQFLEDTLVHHMLRCRVEAGDALEMTGRTAEARVLYERTLRRMEGIYGVEARLVAQPVLWGLARCHARLDRNEAAHGLVRGLLGESLLLASRGGAIQGRWLRRFGSRFGFPTSISVEGVLDAMGPALLAPDDPGHEYATRTLGMLLDHESTSASAGRWLAGRRTKAVPTLIAALHVFEYLNRDRMGDDIESWGRARERLRVAAWRLAGSPAGRAMKTALARRARDEDATPAFRAGALDLLCIAADLPFWIEESKMTPEVSKDVLELWQKTRTRPRADGLRVRVEGAIDLLEEDLSSPTSAQLYWWLVEHTGIKPWFAKRAPPRGDSEISAVERGLLAMKWRRWWAEHGAEDPREWFRGAIESRSVSAQERVDAVLEDPLGLALPGRGEASWIHHFLWLQGPPGRHDPIWRGGLPAFNLFKDITLFWRMLQAGAAPRKPPSYLMVAHMALVDGRPEPIVVGLGFAYLDPATLHQTKTIRFRARFPAEDLPTRRALLGAPGLPHPSPLEPNLTEIFTARASVRSEEGGTILQWSRKDESVVLLKGVSTLAAVPRSSWRYEARPRLADVTRCSWPAPGLHTATHFTFAIPQFSYGGFGQWTLADFRHRLRGELQNLARRIGTAKSRPFSEGALLPFEDDLDHALRLAAYIPMPESAPVLSQIDSDLRSLGGSDRFAGILRGRLLAGDASVLDEGDFEIRFDMAPSDVTPDGEYPARLLLATRDEKIRDFALSRMERRDLPTGVAATLEEAIEEGDLHPPAWLRERVKGSRHRLWWASVIPLLPYYAAAAVVAIFATAAAALALWPRRDRTARLRPAWGMVLCGFIMMSLSLEVNGKDLLPALLGYALAALGAWVLATEGKGLLRLVTPAALAVVIVLAFIPWADILPRYHSWEDRKLAAYAPHLLVAIGICCLPFLSRALLARSARKSPVRLTWPQILFGVFYALPVLLLHLTWTYSDWTGAAQSLGSGNGGVGPPLVIPFGKLEGMPGTLATLAVGAGLALGLWDLLDSAGKRVAARG